MYVRHRWVDKASLIEWKGSLSCWHFQTYINKNVDYQHAMYIILEYCLCHTCVGVLMQNQGIKDTR